MADALLDWAYHSNQTLPGTAVVSLVAANRQLVQAVGGFGLCFFGQHFALTVLLLQSLRVLAGPAVRGLYAEMSRALEAVPPMPEEEARAVLTKADAQLLKVKASAGEARSALQAGTLDTAAAAKLLASAAADARSLATEVATAHATLSRLSAFASAVDPAALHGGLAALGAAVAAAWGAVVRSPAGEVLSGATLGSDTAALLGRLATPAMEVLHEAHLATTATHDDAPGGWSAWLHATRSGSVDAPKDEVPTEPSASLSIFGGLAAVAAGYQQLPPHERRWADAALHATAALLGYLFMRRAKARRLYAASPLPPHRRCPHAAALLPPLQPSHKRLPPLFCSLPHALPAARLGRRRDLRRRRAGRDPGGGRGARERRRRVAGLCVWRGAGSSGSGGRCRRWRRDRGYGRGARVAVGLRAGDAGGGRAGLPAAARTAALLGAAAPLAHPRLRGVAAGVLRRRPRHARSRTADADGEGRARRAAAHQWGHGRRRPESGRVPCQGASQSGVISQSVSLPYRTLA